MENCHLSLIYPLEMVISYSYVSLPEGTPPWPLLEAASPPAKIIDPLKPTRPTKTRGDDCRTCT